MSLSLSLNLLTQSVPELHCINNYLRITALTINVNHCDSHISYFNLWHYLPALTTKSRETIVLTALLAAMVYRPMDGRNFQPRRVGNKVNRWRVYDGPGKENRIKLKHIN